MAAFQTHDGAPRAELRPLRVALRREELFAEARTMVQDLAGWTLVRADEGALELHCERKGGLLSATSRVTITVAGPEGILVHAVRELESSGGLLARDKSVVLEFLTPFRRRVG